MEEFDLKHILFLLLAVAYSLAFLQSVILQVRVFNTNRFLEMSYYIISFYFACMFYKGSTGFAAGLVFSGNYYIITPLRFLPDIFEVPVCAMLSYFW